MTRSAAALPTRRGLELFLCILAGLIGVWAYAATDLNQQNKLPANLVPVAGIWLGICVLAHLAVRIRLRYADPVILPVVLLLNGVGLAMIHRIDVYFNYHTNRAQTQLIWTGLAVACFILLLIVLRDYRVLQRYPYVLFIVGMGLLLLPLIPGLGVQTNGSRIWIHLGSYSFQPAEVAKIVLTLAFASYLADRREALRFAGRKIFGITLPRLRDLAPVGIMWVASVVVMVFQNDLGTSLLFFGLFVMMLYVATEQVGWVVISLIAFAGAAVLIYTQASHVQVRLQGWLHPFDNFDRNQQIIEAQFGMAWGGLLGRGWGMGAPGRVPLSYSDFIAAAIGEELGVVGLSAIILLYLLLVSRGLRTALSARDWFGKLLAGGLSFVIALQVFAIIGGVTRLLPLTGLTTPFMSQGGSSMLANWLIIALLLQISHQARKPVELIEPAQIVDLNEDATAVISLDALTPVEEGTSVSKPSGAGVTNE
jgi:cell division protein FtsW (lipid II flippase)